MLCCIIVVFREQGAGGVQVHEAVNQDYSHVVAEPGDGPADARVLGTGMRVWEIAWAARNYDDLDSMAESLNLDRDLLEEGMRCAAEHADEVEAAIAENEAWTFERLQQVLPGIQLFSPAIDDTDESRQRVLRFLLDSHVPSAVAAGLSRRNAAIDAIHLAD
jgi:uncharacterized protein (DUF433 family)